VTVREFVFVALVVAVVAIGRHVVGSEFVVMYFVAIGALGLLATVANERGRQRLARWLIERGPDAQDRTLVNLENAVDRPELAMLLDRSAPVVPLRAAAEVFRYPRDAARTSKWTMWLSALIALIAAAGWIADRLNDRGPFYGPESQWWEPLALSGGFAASAVFMWWMARESTGELEVSDDGLAWRVPGRKPKVIAWTEVTAAGRSSLARRLVVRAPGRRIAVSDVLIGYGRLTNLVATRLPRTVTWTAS
jgi:hypothetical protein